MTNRKYFVVKNYSYIRIVIFTDMQPQSFNNRSERLLSSKKFKIEHQSYLNSCITDTAPRIISNCPHHFLIEILKPDKANDLYRNSALYKCWRFFANSIYKYKKLLANFPSKYKETLVGFLYKYKKLLVGFLYKHKKLLVGFLYKHKELLANFLYEYKELRR